MNHAAKPTSRTGSPRLATPTDLGANATKDIAGAINALLDPAKVIIINPLDLRDWKWYCGNGGGE